MTNLFDKGRKTMSMDAHFNASRPSDHNVVRALHWRYAAAYQAVEAVPADDPAMSEIYAFALAVSRARPPADLRRVGETWPDLGAAHMLSAADNALRREVEARLL